MARRWFASSEPARGGGARSAAIAAALALAIASLEGTSRAEPAQPGMGGIAPSAVASPSLDEAFLLLPAHDLEITKASGTEPRVGDVLEMSVGGFKLDPAGMKLEVPSGTEPLNDLGWELSPKTPREGADKLEIVAIPLKGGTLTLPSLMIQDSSGKGVARTNPLTLKAQSAIKPDDPKPEEAVELRPPVGLAFPWWVLVVAGLLLLAAIAGALYAVQRWSRKRRPISVEDDRPAVKLSEDVVAMNELVELERQGLLAKGQFKQHYFRTSEVLKRYIGARYRFDAAESTSREIVTTLEEKKFLEDLLIDRLETIFEKLDRVKFTDHVPAPEEGASLIEEARRLVASTRRPQAAILPASMERGGRDAV